MLAEELGYEDQEEFEDALKSSFAEFIGALPHIETRKMESELQPGLIRDVFRVIPVSYTHLTLPTTPYV